MEIYWTKTKTLVSLCLLALVAAVALVKWMWFPHVDETFFSLDYGKLQQAPANVVILRPTQFAESRPMNVMVVPFGGRQGQYDPDHLRMVGRDVGLDGVIAVAYRCQRSHVLLPPDAPTNHYDFLVTVRSHPSEKLAAAVKKQLHYTAHNEMADTEVLELKAGPEHPGLRASPEGGTFNSTYKNGKLYFQHASLQTLTRIAEQTLARPLADKTGLTGFYDFAIFWDYSNYKTTPEAIKKSLAELGLSVVSEVETMPMMKVEKVQ